MNILKLFLRNALFGSFKITFYDHFLVKPQSVFDELLVGNMKAEERPG